MSEGVLASPAKAVEGALRLGPRGGRLRVAAIALALLVAVAAPLLQLRLIAWKVPWRNNDLIPISEGVRAVLRHEDPYSAAATRRIQTIYWGHPLSASEHKDEQHFAYPAYAALVFAPFGALPWEPGRVLFLLVVPVLTALSVPLWLKALRIQAAAGKVALWTLLALASWPVTWGLRLCQVTLPIAFLVAAGCWLLHRGNDAMAGLVLSLAIVKPQSTGPLLAYLCVWALWRRRWAFPVAVLTGCGFLLGWAQWMVPGWGPHWLQTMREYARYTQMGLIPQLLFGRWAGGAIVVLLAAGTTAALWHLRGGSAASRQFALSIALVLAATIALMPAAGGMNYNDVFLLPGLLLAAGAPEWGADAAGWARRLVLGLLLLGYAAVPVAVVLEAVRGASQMSFALPAFPMLVLPAGTVIWLASYALQGRVRQPDGIEA